MKIIIRKCINRPSGKEHEFIGYTFQLVRRIVFDFTQRVERPMSGFTINLVGLDDPQVPTGFFLSILKKAMRQSYGDKME